MYEDLIANLNPKPQFNLKSYKNEDFYSEGEIEDLIIKIIAENKPEDYGEAVFQNFNWSTYYHLSPVRKNIVNSKLAVEWGRLQVCSAMNAEMSQQ